MIHNVVFVIIHFNKHVPVDVKWDFNSKSIVAICLWITLTGHSNQIYNNCIRKKSLKIPKEKSEAINRRHTMVSRKRINGQTMIYKTLQRNKKKDWAIECQSLLHKCSKLTLENTEGQSNMDNPKKLAT
jgi:hypothetical protein